LVYGTITEFNKRYALIYSDIKIGLRLEMVDVNTEQTIWKSEHILTDNTLLANLEILINSLFTSDDFEEALEDALPTIIVYNTAYYALVQYRPFAEELVATSLYPLPLGPFPSQPYFWDEFGDEWEKIFEQGRKSLNPQIFSKDPILTWIITEPIIKTYSPNLKKKK